MDRKPSDPDDDACCGSDDGCGHDHDHDHDHEHGGRGALRKGSHLGEHVFADFAEMMVFFLFGVLIAATMRTFVSQPDLAQLGSQAVFGELTMMTSAFVLSLCSEADAFVARSFTAEFTAGALLSFLVFGPMCDIKLLLMYRAVFRHRFVVLLVGLLAVGTLAMALLVDPFMGGPGG